MISVRTSGGLKEIGSIFVRTSGGLKEIAEVWVRTASGLKQVFGAFSITASDTDVFGSTTSHAPVTVTTSYVTVSPNPPGAATYSWSSSDPGWSATNPTSSTTAFRYTGLAAGDSQSTTFHCTATRGTATAGADVNATVSNFGI